MNKEKIKTKIKKKRKQNKKKKIENKIKKDTLVSTRKRYSLTGKNSQK